MEDAHNSDSDPDFPEPPVPVDSEDSSSFTSGTCTSSALPGVPAIATVSSMDLPATQLPKDCVVLLHNNLSEAQKLEIILHFSTFSPPSSYQFPTTVEYGKKRSFQHHYLQMYKWLGYSAQQDGCLCLPCCLFASDASSAQNFVHRPFSSWTTLNKKVRLHYMSSTHIKCTAAMTCFLDVHSGTQPTIDTSFNKYRQEQYDVNCKRLDAIIDCVVLCGRQNIAFRGHRDASSQTQSVNKGNFKAILDFRALGDPVLRKHVT